MDVQTGLIYAAVVIINALIIGFVSIFAMKEKSYEEAIAEQRKLPDDLLLGKKEKNKEKKHKSKTAKKVKEKKEEKEEKEDKPEHVQFEETPQILPSEPPSTVMQENGKGSKKKGKVEKVKPILVNKDELVSVATDSTSSQPILSREGNHFDVIQPKDDLELIRSHSRENLHRQSSQSEFIDNKSLKETPIRDKKNGKEKDSKRKDDHKDEKKELYSSGQHANKEQIKEIKDKPKDTVKESKDSKEIKEPAKEITVPVQSLNKESKKIKKKNDILAQIGGEKDGVNYSLLESLVQKAELSRSEIQILIDQLLNKQQDNPQEVTEWMGKRTDPVIKLTKQLADKEKALIEKEEAAISVQNKLHELRSELNSERSRHAARVRQLEEELKNKVTDVQTLQTRMQHILESHAAEKQGFSRQIEQLQSKVNEDAAIILKMQEDQGQTHGQLQQELIAQRKQLDAHIAQLRENENVLKAQLAQKHVEFQELQNVNVTMQQELQATCESSTHEIQVLTEQVSIMQEQLMHSEGQIQQFKEAEHEVLRQLEESRRAQSEMEHRINGYHRDEQKLQKKISVLQSELDLVKSQADEAVTLKEQMEILQSELNALKSNRSDPSSESNAEDSQITTLQSQLKSKEQELQKALANLESMETDFTRIQSDVKKLEVDLTEARKELKLTKGELARARDDYKLSQNDLKRCQEELREIQQILTQTQAEFSKSGNAGKELNSGELELQIVKLREENNRLAEQSTIIIELQQELKQIHEKNESLSSQLTAFTERPAVEGRENGIEEKSQRNNIQLVENTNLLSQKEDQLIRLKTELTQKEKELTQLHSTVESLRSEVNKQHSISSRLKDDLEQQRSKNNDLRRKNWKVMEALNSAESRVRNSAGFNDDGHKLKMQEQEATKALLQRIFPEIKISEKSHDQWMKAFEEQANAVVCKKKDDSQSDDVKSELEKTNKNLQAMVNHYKQIIYDTEGMLNKLQSHIESEEKRWQAQLRQKENEVSNLRVEICDLQSRNLSNNQLQQKVADLESRLSEAVSLKEGVNVNLENLHSSNRVQNLALLEQLQEEKNQLSQQFQNESKKRAALDAEIIQLRLRVEASESSLTQEKKVVLQLQQEMSQLKSEIRGGGSSSSDRSTLNGPPIVDAPKSEGGSGKK